jgi:hypothetical protein
VGRGRPDGATGPRAQTLQLQLRSIDVELEETRSARDDAERAAAEARRELQERSRVSFPDGLPHEPRALPPTPAGEDPVLVEVLLRRTRAEAETRTRAEREEEVRWLTEALSETRAEANALRKEAETLAGNAQLARLTADEDSAQALRRAVALQEETVALRGMVETAPPGTKWTRRVPHPVLSGHAASLTPY